MFSFVRSSQWFGIIHQSSVSWKKTSVWKHFSQIRFTETFQSVADQESIADIKKNGEDHQNDPLEVIIGRLRWWICVGTKHANYLESFKTAAAVFPEHRSDDAESSSASCFQWTIWRVSFETWGNKSISSFLIIEWNGLNGFLLQAKRNLTPSSLKSILKESLKGDSSNQNTALFIYLFIFFASWLIALFRLRFF